MKEYNARFVESKYDLGNVGCFNVELLTEAYLVGKF